MIDIISRGDRREFTAEVQYERDLNGSVGVD